ncbi:hypothetical protein [Flavobacterium sp. LM4]|uniref:hypothetical protein n=1 Tax=Flavobacterium sp. LM4 TaxID=1938609 RepID=UPI000991A616|nr:hypothetical protein [Flavobacterium sp. LM4]OOV19122.1 hypothetical protein BXU10_05475 [Flavobacterium sp. LM4]
MKKLLLFLALAVTFNLSAQTISTTYFAKPLELNSVPVSTSKSDSVIVRGADKILKFVPRSEFSGGGGSQDLQQTLDKGTTAISNVFAVNGPNGRFSLDNTGVEMSNIGYGALNIGANGLVLDNRGNSYPINLLGRNSGVYVQGAYGNYLKLQTGVVELRSVTGLDIDNQSNLPMNIKSWGDKVNIDGWAGVNLKSQNGTANIEASQNIKITSQSDVHLKANDTLSLVTQSKLYAKANQFEFISGGALNQLYISDSTGKISLQSQSGGIELNSSSGPVVIKNSTGAGVQIGDASVSSPLSLKSGAFITLESQGLAARSNTYPMYVSGAGLYLDNNAGTGGQFHIDPTGIASLSAGSGKAVEIYGNALDVHVNKAKYFNPVELPVYTVDTLPVSPGYFVYATVSDAASPAYLQPVNGGGTTVCPVIYNGTTWVAH